MKNTIRFIVSLQLVFTFFFTSLPNANACGPFILSPVFSLRTHADFPLTDFTGGRGGIVPDSFDTQSLFVYYRQLNNLPLTRNEQKLVIDSMRHQIFYRSGTNDTYGEEGSPKNKESNYLSKWLAARGKVSEEKQEIDTNKYVPDSYFSFANCLPDAFINATKTLEQRLAKYGNNENVKEWLKGQDAVFLTCGEEKALPEMPGKDFPKWLKRDRAYQIAAAQFYLGKYAEARKSFEKVAADKGSVWKKTARFVVARTYIREASFIGDSDGETANTADQKKRKELLQKASENLQSLLKVNSMKDFHASAQRLFGLVKYRMIPGERRKELAGLLVSPSENKNLYHDLTDYVWLFNKTAGEAENVGVELDRKQAEKENKQYDYNYLLKLRDVPSSERQEDLTDWLFTYQAVDGFSHAFEKWKETAKLHWFVAAIGKTGPKSEKVAEILSEAGRITSGSPGFATVRYHQIRLLTQQGKRNEARILLDGLMSNDLKDLPVSTQNKFLAQRTMLAKDLEEFLRYAQRRAVIFSYDDTGREEGTSIKDDEFLSGWETRTMFDTDAVAFLNEKVPLSVLRQAALSRQLPGHLKKFLTVAVWTRAFILGNKAVTREFAPLVSRYGNEYRPLISKYISARGATNREAAAMIAILRYPVIQPYVPVGFGREDSRPTTIDSIRGNWWCAESEATRDYSSYDEYEFNYPQVYPDFLTAGQKAAARRELRQILAEGDSATFLAHQAVDFAKAHPRHRKTPEILHLAVRSTRYGCKDANTGKWSKQAFDILHRRYRNSEWTKKTPYWFAQ